MKYLLMEYVREAGWKELSPEDQERWLGAYKAFTDAMEEAGVLRDNKGLQPTSFATTVRIRNDKTQVLDGPYADSKEQLGGYRLIEVDNLDEALSWASRSPTALHGVVEVRPIMDYLPGREPKECEAK